MEMIGLMCYCWSRDLLKNVQLMGHVKCHSDHTHTPTQLFDFNCVAANLL